MHTRASTLYYALLFAMRPMTIEAKRGRMKVRLTDEESRLIAEAVIERLKLHGDLWKLDEEMPVNHGPAPSF
ncbi:hypothetical protein [Pseudolabrys sp. FHR47]|uniref:hypothetical protein n=1 Tax=Pseudolabrys sp. FHR47 TaxID=2562284 RepID=UPI0010BED19C|nr:hypothetical protein [Pseudolabrys sp. FHR47]